MASSAAPPPPPRGEFDEWELELIGHLVRDFLQAHPSYASADFDDLTQECLTHWWLRRGSYSASRGASRKTHLRTVVQNKLRDLERERRATKRGGGQADLSLEKSLPGAPELTLGDVLADREADQESDVRRAMERLTGRQREIAEALREGLSKVEAAREAGVSRDTLYEELAQIREIFRDEGLWET